MMVVFWRFGFVFGCLLVFVFPPKISRLIFAPNELCHRISTTGKYGDFPNSSIEQSRCDSCLVFVQYKISLVRQGCCEVGILDTESMSYTHTH